MSSAKIFLAFCLVVNVPCFGQVKSLTTAAAFDSALLEHYDSTVLKCQSKIQQSASQLDSISLYGIQFNVGLPSVNSESIADVTNINNQTDGIEILSFNNDVTALENLGQNRVGNETLEKLSEVSTENIEQSAMDHVELSPAEKLLREIHEQQKAIEAASAPKDVLNHFKGHEAKLENAMKNLAKYKKRFRTLRDVNNVPLVPPNEMKGKPLSERIIPGSILLIQKGEKAAQIVSTLDISYRISGRFAPGMGAIYQWAATEVHPYLTNNNSFYGFNVFLKSRVFKEFFFRIEWQRINCPSADNINNDPPLKTWQNIYFLSAGTQKKLSNRFNGSTWITHQLFRDSTSPYPRQVMFRIGFEFLLYNHRKAAKEDAKKTFSKGNN
jgi:hypothetical protein